MVNPQHIALKITQPIFQYVPRGLLGISPSGLPPLMPRRLPLSDVASPGRNVSGPTDPARTRTPIIRPGSRAVVFWLAGALALALPNHARSDDVATLEQLKQMSVEALMDVEVTSVSRRAQKLSETPSAIQVINSEDILRSGATSIPEALRLADNLNVAQKNSHDWAISARGFNTDLANKLLVMIDGRTVYTPLYSGVFWDAQDYLLADINRIEVISGPGGTLWGANAVNGVINIVTESAKDTQGYYAEGGWGDMMEGFGGVRYGGKLSPNVYFRIYGKHTERDSEAVGSGATADDSWQKSQGGFRLDVDEGAGSTFTFQGDLYGGTTESTVGQTKTDGNNLLARWSRTLADDSELSVQVYYDRTHLASPKPALLAAAAGVLTDDLDTYDFDLQHHFRAGPKHQIVWGLGYRLTDDDVGNSPTVGFLPPHLQHNLFSGFLQDEIALTDDLHLTLGTKVEHNDYTGVELEPSGRLQYILSSRQSLWTAVSRAVRTPSRIDRDLVEYTGLSAPLPTAIFSGGPDFVSETVVAYEAGYRTQIGENTSAAVSVFYNTYDHIRSFTAMAPYGFPLVTHNNVEGDTYGLEFTATTQVTDGWRLRAGYNLLEEDLRVKPGQVDFSNALNETADPKHQLSLRSSLDVTKAVALDTGLRWVDTLHNNNGPTPGTVPSYFELDVRLAWQATKQLELALVGRNLLHDQHAEYGYPGATRTEIQRSIYGKVTWRY